MTKDEVKAVVDRHIKQLLWDFGINMWTVTLKYVEELADETFSMQVQVVPDYHQATISIRPDMHDTDDEVLRNLEHELLHVVLSPYDVSFDVAYQFAPSTAARHAMNRMNRLAAENSVTALQEMLKRIKYHPDNIFSRPHPEFRVNTLDVQTCP